MRRRPKSAVSIAVWAAVVLSTMIVARWQNSDGAPASPKSRSTLEQLDRVERTELDATVARIRKGGPFPYPNKDGSVFANREKLLPAKPRGYYREYTVPTPGAKNRGARRVVRGEAGELWYTRDHYKTFVRIE
ncbi:MAG TPA: ribonuclease domain-containing protein [Thermoanaerobaculia bacterium]|jgi:ribonuclease T1|nr:ribonuclease domain-containing protein [Thermoanaerobaculia bacterium]